MSMNQICDPDDPVTPFEHKHQCKSCGTTWKHGDDVADATAEEFDEAHSCPRCGQEETFKLMDVWEKRKRQQAFARLARLLDL